MASTSILRSLIMILVIGLPIWNFNEGAGDDWRIDKAYCDKYVCSDELNKAKTAAQLVCERQKSDELLKLSTFTNQKKDCDEKLSALQDQVSVAQKKIDSIKMQVADATQKYNQIRYQLETEVKQLSDLKNDIASAAGQLQSTQNMTQTITNDKTKQLSDLKAQLDDLNQQIGKENSFSGGSDKCTADLSTSTSLVQSLTSQLDAATQACGAPLAQIQQQIESQKIDFTTQVNSYKNFIAQTQSDIQSTQTTCTQQLAEINTNYCNPMITQLKARLSQLNANSKHRSTIGVD